MCMAFWDNVVVELEFLGMTNKALAEKVGIAASNIGKGIQQNSSPSADTAFKIAKVLGVSMEYLVTGSNFSESQSETKESAENQIHLYKKYHSLIENMEKISLGRQKIVSDLAATLATE